MKWSRVGCRCAGAHCNWHPLFITRWFSTLLLSSLVCNLIWSHCQQLPLVLLFCFTARNKTVWWYWSSVPFHIWTSMLWQIKVGCLHASFITSSRWNRSLSPVAPSCFVLFLILRLYDLGDIRFCSALRYSFWCEMMAFRLGLAQGGSILHAKRWWLSISCANSHTFLLVSIKAR